MSTVPCSSKNIGNETSMAHQTYAELVLSKQHHFFNNKLLCDVVLIAGNDGKRISAHRLVLAAVSDYFAAMFTGPHREAFEKEITLHKVNGNILEVLVKYCYTGLLEYSKDLAEDVLITANLLQLSTAVTKCGDFWVSQLDPANCLGFITFAERHNCQSLVKSATEYICTNFIEVCKTDEFKQLNAKELGKLLLNDDLNVPSEENVFSALQLWVEHDFDKRKKHIFNLLGSIRLSLLSPLFISENVEKFCDSDECQRPIKEAYKYHLLPNKRSKVCTSRRRADNNFSLIAVSSPTSYVESYCAQKQNWNTVPNPQKQIEIRFYAMNILDDKLFVAGGLSDYFVDKLLQYYDKKTGMLTSVNSMQTKRDGFTAIVLNGLLYAIGGYENEHENECSDIVERWNPSTKVWNNVASMNSSRAGASAAVLNDKIYVCGGEEDAEEGDFNTLECYDPITNVWTIKALTNTRRYGFGIAVLNGYIYAVGGLEEETAERYDPVSDVWTFIASLNFDAKFCEVLENRLIAVGGTRAAEYNPETNEWKRLGDLFLKADNLFLVPKKELQFS